MPPTRSPRYPSKALLWAEFTFLCVILPLQFVYLIAPKHLFGVLWVFALYALWILKRNHGLSLRTIWNGGAFTKDAFLPIMLRFIGLALLLGVWVADDMPDKLFSFPKEKPQLWALVMMLYPLLSVIPQEIVFRPFFFHRYQPLFPQPWLMLAASSIAFGFAHVLFQNWIAVVLCMAGGLLFALTYQRTRSLALAWAEHALYGCFIFTIGLGYYFYHGSLQAAKTVAGA